MPFLLILIFLLLNISAVSAQSLTKEQTDAIGKVLLADVPEGGPGGALGIVLNGEVIYTNYAGFADLDTKRAINENTRFNVASNAKQFTALAALKLAREGKLKLTDDVRKYLPNLFPKVVVPITIANLINHTSGIRDVYNLWGFQGITWWKQTLNNDDALKLIQDQQELNFTPGSAHLYSNTNYILLTHIIAQVTGKSFRVYTDELFRELGMTSTNFVSDHQEMGPEVGRPYFNFDTWTTYKWRTDLHGDGSLFSSLKDQLVWEVALQKTSGGNLSPELLTESQLAVNNDADYGFGLERGSYRGVPVRWHDGSTGAWDASFIRFPALNLSIVAADNSGKFGTNQLVRAVADIVLENVFTQEAYPTAPAVIGAEIPIKELIGTYLTDGGFSFTFKMVEGKLVLEREGRSDTELELEAGNIYHQKFDTAFKQEFTRGNQTGMQVTAYYWAHAPYTLTRSAVDWRDYDFAGIEGEYHNDELNLTFSVSFNGDRTYTIKSDKRKYKAKLYQRDRILAGGNRGRIVRDSTGSVLELLISDDRTRDLRFTRK